MTEWEDDGFILSARAHGETGAIVEFLTENHGRHAAHIAGAASRRIKPFLQAGARVVVMYRARVADQLGSATLEPIGEGPSALFDDPLALAGLSSAASVVAGALPERQVHSGAYRAFEALVSCLSLTEIWPAVYVRFEAGLLEDLGFGLDLSRCAATGDLDNLVYVSPRTGRAVSRAAGEPYRDKLLALPPFMLSAQGGLATGDVGAGLALTGYFLEHHIFAALNRPLPTSRTRMIERLREAGAL